MISRWASRLLLAVLVGIAGPGASRAELPDELTLRVKAGGHEREVLLHKYSIRAGRFRVRTWHQGRGYVTAAAPEITTYRGTVADEPNTRVCAVIKPLTGLTIYAHAGKTPIWRVTNEAISPRFLRDPAEALMPDDEVLPEAAALLEDGFLAVVQPSGQMPPPGPIQRAQMALDIAKEHLMGKYAGDWAEALANLEFTVNRYDDFMVRDTKMSFELTEVVVRMDQYYDYEGSPLKQVRNHWSTQQDNLNWDFAGLFISPKNWPSFSYGGVAYVPGSYFVNVLFHESGHNLNAIHHLYGQDCMNGNRNAHWAALNAERIIDRRNRLEARFTNIEPSAYAEPVHPYATPDLASTFVNEPVEIDVLANDWDGNDDEVFIHSFTETTVPGGAVSLFRGGLRYTPPQSYVGKDIIVYTIADSTGLLNTDLVSIEVINGWLAAHWRLDEVDPSSPRFVAGRHAFDASGNGHDALLPENYESVPGVDGRAIKIPSGSSMICDDSSIVPAAPDHWVKPLWHSYPVEEQASNFFDPMDASFSLKFSFNVTDFGDSEEPAILFKKANKANLGYSITADPNGIYFKVREWGGLYKTKELEWNDMVHPGTWYHVTMVIDRSNNTLRAWVDGQLVSGNVRLTPGSFI
ncbi:MAG: Ig-like domain-containing protein, partial [Planctomycetota bacterium]